MYRILIVEDDAIIARTVAEHIRKWGCEAVCAQNFEDVCAEFIACQPQLVLLDINLPFFSGYHWCREIRKISTVPIMFLSSASDGMNVVMAMEMGGDDFIAKPFDLTVLTAKVQALLRRAYDFSGRDRWIEHKGALLDMRDACLIYQGEKVELTKNEYRILKMLMESKGNLVSRDAIIEGLWESDDFIDENTLTVNVARLRRKLEAAGLKNYIATRKGMGYVVQ